MKRIVILFVLLNAFALHGNCENTAFQAGEKLTYKLFFNWKFVWVSAGTAYMTTEDTGDGGFSNSLVTHTSKRIDRFFMMRDTLLSIVDKNIVPQYYRKVANEGGKRYLDEVWYSYADGNTHLRQEYTNRFGTTKKSTYDSPSPIYDMLSLMMHCRSLDASRFQKGQKIQFPMADGDEVENVTLIYRGKKNFQMEDSNVKYRCLVFSFVEYEKGKEKEIITFYVTDDANHAPVRLDLFLKFGIAKAYLSAAEGFRSVSTSIIEK